MELGLEDIRERMQASLGDADLEYLRRRIRLAADTQALWFLRGHLMQALSSLYGESGAREQMDELTHMFTGLLPRGLKSRHSPLGD